ncbi:MAG: DUF4011 domain-containing protein, partial [Candidatus Sericytochromatia bacterium]|nr:DUF4011 domain-containing protein [Candidatus Sericytochromatia bacterium]
METTAVPGTAPQQVTTALRLSPVVCFAMEQAGIPLIQSLEIRHHGLTPLTDLQLTVQLSSGLGETVRLALSDLYPGESVSLGVIDYPLALQKLRQVDESERARWEWRLTSGGNIVSAGSQDVDVLAFNHWPGSRVTPMLMAAYVLPNHPAVGTLLLSIRERLQALTHNPALDGYQSRSLSRTTAMVQAVYDTIQASGLTYAEVPASFEAAGQKVRLPDRLMQDKVGCCLDISLLVAACFEQMGLHPLIAMIEGHAFVGVWLVEDRFPEGVVDDAARIRTAMALGHLLMCDSSAMVDARRPTLGQAVTIAQGHLADDAGFRYVLDLRAVRLAGYRPMPLRMATLTDVAAVVLPMDRDPVPVVDPATPAVAPAVAPNVDGTRARLLRWQEKLLDLSLRNRLLNFPMPPRAAVLLDVPDLARLEARLAADVTFELLPPPAIPGEDQRDATLAKQRMPTEEWQSLLLEDLGKGVLHAAMGDEALMRTLKGLDRETRAAFEESGVHSLYLACGFLRWYESLQADKARFAPLLLYPVTVAFDRGTRRYTVRRQSEEPVANITLVEKMRRDFDVDLSALLTPESDDSGLDLARLLRQVREAVRQMPRWDVAEQAAIGQFSFTKFLMWRDLAANAATLLANPVVRHLASPEQGGFEQAVAAVSAETLDADLPPEAIPCVVDADSTQMAAIASALAGRNFVLQGPPGTGKSQTITNMVAALVFQGKSVLFVSEKMAALDVVHRRLQEVGLGDFCLELHSHKSNKRAVVESFMTTLRRADRVGSVPWESRSRELQTLRARLNELTQALHRPQPVGWTFHQAVARLVGVAAAPEVRFAMPGVGGLTADTYRTMVDQVAEFAVRAQAVGTVATNVWQHCRAADWTAAGDEVLQDRLADVLIALAAVEQAVIPLAKALNVRPGGSTATLKAWSDLARSLAVAAVPAGALMEPDWLAHERRAHAYVAAQRDHDRRRAELASRWEVAFLASDISGHRQQFRKAQDAWPVVSDILAWQAKRALGTSCREPDQSTADMVADLEGIARLQADAAALAQDRTWLWERLDGLWGGNSESLGEAERLLTLAAIAAAVVEPFRAAGLVTAQELMAVA